MLTRLEEAFAEIARLPEQEREAIAAWILEELEEMRRWDEAFTRSADKLAALACEAREEHRRGETLPLDPDEL